MPVDNLRFGDTVDSWVKATDERMTAVFRESTKRLISLCQKRIPIDTGFARASIQASLESMPQVDPDKTRPGDKLTGFSFSWDIGEFNTVIAQAQLGDTIYVGWTAAYVVYLEYGHSKQAPEGFVRLSAMEWPQIVSEVTDLAKSTAAINRGLA